MRVRSSEVSSEYKILALDDEQGIIDALTLLLKKNKYYIKGFTDPVKALERLKNEHYDMLILDYLIGNVHGDKVVESIREFDKDLYILLLTGHKDLAPPIKTMKTLDIQGYCEKSNRFDQLLLLVESGIKIISQMRIIKKINEELKKTHDELSFKYSELEQFSYVASHDLQEPLRVVTGFAQLLQRRYEGRLDSEADEFIGFIIDGAGRMKQLINDLLQYSRIGVQSKEMQAIDCNSLVDRVMSQLRVAISESGAIIECDQLPCVEGNELLLSQLFQNLIGNAIKFRSSNSPHIRITADNRESEVVFSIKDNGIGIEPEYFDRIFLIFQRLHSKGEYPGSGIGLAICKKIVEQHGGRIWVEAANECGTTFCFSLHVTDM